MMNEIGSEFHSIPYGEGTGIVFPKMIRDYSLTFSGRTAIETVLRNSSNIKKALLPSYCCDSMIEPFRRLGIAVSFYGVNYRNGLKIESGKKADVDCVVWCNYFGFNQTMPDFNTFIKRGSVLIEDITHSFYSEQQYHEESTYLVASLRKWEPINCGGYCASVSGELKKKPQYNPPNEFVVHKRKAMELKEKYLTGKEPIDKTQFLEDFAKSNSWLAENYTDLTIDRDSEQFLQMANQDEEKKQRIKNARRLYKEIKTGENVSFLFDENEMDCPLFVPIIVRNGKRNAVRKELINRNIYCPIHWPHPQANCESNLYDMELSLVCDQRYTEDDMSAVATALNEISNSIII